MASKRKANGPPSACADAPRREEGAGPDADACPVCLEALEPGKAIFQAECSHRFHFTCVQANALHGNTGCPLCRTVWATPPAVPPPLPTVGMPHAPPRALLPPRRDVMRGAPQFSDDDDVVPPVASTASAAALPLTLHVTASASCVPSGVADSPLSALLTVRAPAAAAASSATPDARGGVDLVAVLDVSGSMSGTKLTLLRATLLSVIDLLRDEDRLSVVAFSHSARRLTPLSRMHAAGKAAARAAVAGLTADGGTDIGRALELAVAVVTQRRQRNPVTGVLLLTDGQDGGTLSQTAPLAAAAAAAGATLTCFGYGAEHDARLLEGLSESGRGNFTFIETNAAVRDAFAVALGGLFSTAAQRVEITLTPRNGATLREVHAPGGRRQLEGGGFSLDLEDLFSEESRDVVVELALPACEAQQLGDADVAAMSYLDVALTWLPPGGAEAARLSAPAQQLAVLRPAEAPAPTDEQAAVAAAAATALDRQRNRVAAAEATAAAVALADTGAYEAAVAGLRAAAAAITASATGADPFCAALAADVLDTAERVGSRAAYATGGSAKARMSHKSNIKQRKCAADFHSPSAMLYVSPAMTRAADQLSGGAGGSGTMPPPPPPAVAAAPAVAARLASLAEEEQN